MKSKENKTDKALDYLMGRFVPAYLGILIALVVAGCLALGFCGCYSEPPAKPEEIELSHYPFNDDRCPFTGDIVRIEGVTGSDETLGGSGLIMVMIQPDPPDETGIYAAAVASRHDNFSVGDRIEVCQVKVLTRHRLAGDFRLLFTARKLPDYSYGTSETQKFEECQDDLADSQYNLAKCSLLNDLCDAKASAADDLVKAMDANKEDK